MRRGSGGLDGLGWQRRAVRKLRREVGAAAASAYLCVLASPPPPRPAAAASQHAARLMAAQGSGLIVSVSFGAGGGSSPYLGNLYYDLAKASLNR